jgi:hypothetical protein
MCANCASAWDVSKFSDDAEIRSALRLLDNINANEVFENLKANSVKIIFYDLSQIDFSYYRHHAINSIDNSGRRYILINSRYKNASKEQIACLIAHESFHKGKKATMKEETLATKKEAYYWSILKVPGKMYSNSSLTNRLDSLAYLYRTSSNENNLIEQRIQNSKFYQDQLITTRNRI